MIVSLLIANRGEIACRIIRTTKRMGIRSVAVYSDADARALHVRQADQAIHIGPSPARESYLVGEKIIAAARESGAEAIHPGYGFLSENAEFAQAVIDAGLIWVGPKPQSIRAMGLKDAAKKLMADAGVPVTPGYLGEDQSPDRLKREAYAIGYPVLIKAIAGGGGKGMRRVNEGADFDELLASCKREAASAFGDDRVLIEKYVERPRHIEVQVFGDSHGNIVHLFERDCSLQRRHQKVIEEAPAPGMDEATRAAICDAAVRAARAVDYVGAGTIEFIADASQGLRADRIWFMEMNTRLQVEHPVTEEITGQDLVEWQLRVASGETLPKQQDELAINGWAMEARLYAEDPSNEFLPSTGRLDHFVLDASIRIETGVQGGDVISPYYDPMIAKYIAHRPTREAAIAQLRSACASTEVWPVRTNAGFLARCLNDAEFKAARVHTGFIAGHIQQLISTAPPDRVLMAATSWRVEEFMDAAHEPLATRVWSSSPDHLFGFRLNADPEPARIRFHDAQGHHDLEVTIGPGKDWQFDVVLDGRSSFENPLNGLPTTHGAAPRRPYRGEIHIFDEGEAYGFTFGDRPLGEAAAGGDGIIVSPMPGRLISVDVGQGAKVSKGQKLLTIEAMKMEHSLVAPFDGIVSEVQAVEGAQVTEGALLVRIEKALE